MNAVSAFDTIQEDGAYSLAAAQHPPHTRGNRRMVYGVLLLTEWGAFYMLREDPMVIG